MIQTWAILKDAYRELNARKMFWISIGICLLVVCVFAMLGINEKGIEVLFWTWPIDEHLTTKFISKSLFYKSMFSIVGLTVWLGWCSTMLALVSTSSLIPDFVSSGAIEGMLARPISRVRLFLTKYCAGLLFVFFQALVFCTASIFVIGLRSGVWMWPLILAVPLVTLFFSYLYSVSALVGVWTRSTLASLVAALALWGVVFVVGFGESKFLEFKLTAEHPLAIVERDIEARELQLRTVKQKSADPADYAALEKRLEDRRTELAEKREDAARTAKWYSFLYTAKTILPKTSETRDLVDRALSTDAEMARTMGAFEEDAKLKGKGSIFDSLEVKIKRQVIAVQDSRTIWWVIGTSLIFEAVIVAFACRIFAKRDF